MIQVRSNQSLLDIAVQEYGSAEAVFLLAEANGMQAAEVLSTAEEVYRPDKVVNKSMENYCKTNRVRPATNENVDTDLPLRIFTEQFTKQYT